MPSSLSGLSSSSSSSLPVSLPPNPNSYAVGPLADRSSVAQSQSGSGRSASGSPFSVRSTISFSDGLIANAREGERERTRKTIKDAAKILRVLSSVCHLSQS